MVDTSANASQRRKYLQSPFIATSFSNYFLSLAVLPVGFVLPMERRYRRNFGMKLSSNWRARPDPI